jgi:hypothetical protein
MTNNPTPPDLENASPKLREAHNMLCDKFSKLEKDIEHASAKTRSKLDFLLTRIQELESKIKEDE